MRLEGDDFEQWCQIFFRDHGFELFRLDRGSVTIEAMPAGYKAIDLILLHSENRVRAGIQCKGGQTRIWTEPRIRAEHDKICGDLERLIEEEKITDYVFVCTTRVDDGGRKLLNAISKRLLKRDAMILDRMVLEPYLQHNSELRLHLCCGVS